MATRADSDKQLCTVVRWCEEKHDHDGPHTRYLADLTAADRSGRAVALSVLRSGVTNGDRHVELLISGRSCVVELMLTRYQQALLARAIERG